MANSVAGKSKDETSPARENRRRTLFVMGAILAVLFLFSYLGRVADLVQARGELAQWQGYIGQAEERQAQLREELQQVQSKSYTEEVARNELHMAAPGEEVIIVLPDDSEMAGAQAQAAEQEPDPETFNPFRWSWWLSLFR